MNDPDNLYKNSIIEAQKALRDGDNARARSWAHRAADINPNREDAWLILAAVASPRASIEFLNKALQINPSSERARKGMNWAVHRLRSSQESTDAALVTSSVVVEPVKPGAMVRQKTSPTPLIAGLFVLAAILMVWLSYPSISSIMTTRQPRALAQEVEKATRTSIPTNTETPTTQLTDTPTFTPLPTATDTPTATLAPTDTATPLPTNTSEPPPTEAIPPTEPPEPTLGPDGKRNIPDVAAGVRWIDVDLSQQRVYAFEGDQMVENFLVSTGTALTPTVLGQYRIYVKYRSANMSGPGYFLPDVPYVMYFYKGYGLHGTYWHKNFGTPMSHGCVNLKTREAKWLFDWASVGTMVYVHR